MPWWRERRRRPPRSRWAQPRRPAGAALLWRPRPQLRPAHIARQGRDAVVAGGRRAGGCAVVAGAGRRGLAARVRRAGDVAVRPGAVRVPPGGDAADAGGPRQLSVVVMPWWSPRHTDWEP